MSSVKTDYSNASVWTRWSLHGNNVLGIASRVSPTTFNAIEVTEVSGAGSATAAAPGNAPVNSKPESAP